MSSIKYYHMIISEEGRYAFVPAERGRWIKTHLSAFFVACTNKHCMSAVKTPCISLTSLAKFDQRVFQVPVHKERKAAYQAYRLATSKAKTDEGGKITKLRRREQA